MIGLREQIEDHIAKLLEISQTWPDDSDLRNAQSRHSGDHILALIAEAMLSFPALKAAAGELPYYPEDVDNGNIEMAGDAIKLALTAAGIAPGDAPRQLSVEFACGSQEYWDLEPDGSLRIDIPHDRVVVSSTDLDDAPGLDELLDSVHPRAWIAKCIPPYDDDNDWDARICWPLDGSDTTMGGCSDGTGPTRMEAIANAVARATGTT